MPTHRYAVVGSWTMAPSRWEEQLRGLHEQIVPLVCRHPGFVAAYWLGDRDTGKAHSTIILEDEAAARRFQALVEEDPASRSQAGVTMDTLAIIEVVA